MKRLAAVLVLSVIVGVFYLPCFAASEYVIANTNTVDDNSLVVLKLDTATGSLKQIAVLETGGLGTSTTGDLAELEQAITPSGRSVFALNAESSDIASFSAATGYTKVGNYSNSGLDASENGGGLALTPDGKFLYASYSTTQNIAAWVVNSDCSLTFLAAYVPSGGGGVGALKVTPNGAALVAPLQVGYGGAEMFAINKATGALVDVSFISFFNQHYCVFGSPCPADGLDFTKDSKYVVFASVVSTGVPQGTPIAITCEVTPAGLANPHGWSLYDPVGLGVGNQTPFFGATGYAGDGSLYFGMTAGVMTTSFTERPLKIKVTKATLIVPTGLDGAIAVTGNLMVVAEYPNQIGVFSINADGSLTELSATTLKGDRLAMFSLSVFPSSR